MRGREGGREGGSGGGRESNRGRLKGSLVCMPASRWCCAVVACWWCCGTGGEEAGKFSQRPNPCRPAADDVHGSWKQCCFRDHAFGT